MPDPLPFAPAEALILLDPARWHGREAIKATFLALLARGALRLETRPGRGWLRRRTTALSVGANPLPALPPHETALVDMVRDADRFGGSITTVVQHARSRYGANLNRFDRTLVRPGLIRRGLVTETRRPILFFFDRRRDVLTAAGEAARGQIADAMQRVRTIPAALASDPAAAAAIAVGAGAAIFLVPEMKAYYAQLSAAMRRNADGGGGPDTFNADTLDGDSTGPDLSGFDLGGFDLSGFDLGAFDSIDSAMASFDAGFDSAADGGSDGGGGDGGGSSC